MDISKEKMLALYEGMYKIRRFEETTAQRYAGGEIPGFVHMYVGEEAIATGVCGVLNDNDYITSTHRGHGHLVAKGGDLKLMMAELYGKKTGYNKGKGGSLHICNMDLGIMGANGIVGAGLPISVGAGLAFKMMDTGRVCVCFFGDGASNRGVFHESLNMASILKLPVIFVCENNQYGISACVTESMNIADVSTRAVSYGIGGIKVDGNDVLAVYNATKSAVEFARTGGGPTLIEAKTWRRRGHHEGDADNYRDPEICKSWLENDPIERFGEAIIAKGVASKTDLEKIEQKVEEEMNKAVEFAKESPQPDPQDVFTDVYAS